MRVKISEEIKQKLHDPFWTINHLYRIVDKQSLDSPFQLNWAQKAMFENLHTRNIVLKARQIGSTTFWCLFFLNWALFKPNQRLGIISYNLPSAHDILGKIIKHALRTLPEGILNLPQTQIKACSAREISFANGSSIRVDTTMRSGTLSGLLVTEFGKICARYPQKAEEIMTGSINTVPRDATVVIESTAEGASGYFFDLCKKAQEKEETVLSSLDWKFFFFPWWKHADYELGNDKFSRDIQVTIPKYLKNYFDSLEKEHGICLSVYKKNWYTLKYNELGDSIKQEYPSTPQESFMGSTDGFWFLKELLQAKQEKRVTCVPYQPQLSTYTAWDIGYNDSAAIWVYQLLPSGSVHVIDYYENSSEGLAHYLSYLRRQRYFDTIEAFYFPHDAAATDFATGLSVVTQAKQLGVKATVLDRYNSKLNKSTFVLEVQRARNLLARCYFDEEKTAIGIRNLESYRKKWNEQMGCYTSEAVHDFASHGSDAFRYMAQAIDLYAKKKGSASLEDERNKARSARMGFI